MTIDSDRSTQGVASHKSEEPNEVSNSHAPPVLFTLRSWLPDQNSRICNPRVSASEIYADEFSVKEESPSEDATEDQGALDHLSRDLNEHDQRSLSCDELRQFISSGPSPRGDGSSDLKDEFLETHSKEPRFLAAAASSHDLMETSEHSVHSKNPSGDHGNYETSGESTAGNRSAFLRSGRAWFRTIGSHGLVILLLLGVVAAALLTGDTPEIGTPDQVDLLSFEDSTIDLPLPDLMEIDLGQPETNIVVAPSTIIESEAAVPSDELVSNPSSDKPNSALQEASLAVANSDSRSGAENPEMEFKAVSAIKSEKSITSNEELLPSLEQLAEDSSESHYLLDRGAARRNSPEETKTPSRIKDWLQFLPPIERVAAESDSSISSIK